jgi:hypothetical protein
VFEAGVSGNPNGRPKGARNRRTQEVLDLIQGRGDKDPLDALSEIVTTNQDANIVATASNILAPYLHSKKSTLPPKRYVEEVIEVPDFQSIDQAQDFQKDLARRAAAGELELQVAQDISALIGHWIRSRQDSIELDLKVQAAGGSGEQIIRIEGGLPVMPGHEQLIMPVNGHTLELNGQGSALPAPDEPPGTRVPGDSDRSAIDAIPEPKDVS